MKKLAASLMLVVAGAFVMGSAIEGGEKESKEVTLKGKICCGKCELRVDKKCATVIVTKKGEKETVYYFDPASGKKFHKDICTEAKTGTVTGVVSKKGAKHIITVKKVSYD